MADQTEGSVLILEPRNTQQHADHTPTPWPFSGELLFLCCEPDRFRRAGNPAPFSAPFVGLALSVVCDVGDMAGESQRWTPKK